MPSIKNGISLSTLGNAVLGSDIISPNFSNNKKSSLTSQQGLTNWSVIPDSNLNIYTGFNISNAPTIFNAITGATPGNFFLSETPNSNGNGPGTIGMERRRQTRSSVNSGGFVSGSENTIFGTTGTNISASPILNQSSSDIFVRYIF